LDNNTGKETVIKSLEQAPSFGFRQFTAGNVVHKPTSDPLDFLRDHTNRKLFKSSISDPLLS
jgi:hypothetical protein